MSNVGPKLNYLWLDDERPAPTRKGWDWVKDYETFVGFIEANPVPLLASLDHDLCAEHYDTYVEIAQRRIEASEALYENCGLDCVRAMIERDWLPATVVVHTMNSWGQQNMVKALLDVGYTLDCYSRVPRANPISPLLRKTIGV
jgi:hypothetical protein